MLSALHNDQPGDHQRVAHYHPYASELDLSGVTFPAWLDSIPLVEARNGLHINVFGYEDKKVFPLWVSQDPQNAINLILLTDAQAPQSSHWAWIKYFSRLASNRRKARRFFWFRCVSGHNTADALERHQRYCTEHPIAFAEMPNPGERLRFNNQHKQLKVPCVSTLRIVYPIFLLLIRQVCNSNVYVVPFLAAEELS